MHLAFFLCILYINLGVETIGETISPKYLSLQVDCHKGLSKSLQEIYDTFKIDNLVGIDFFVTESEVSRLFLNYDWRGASLCLYEMDLFS